MTDLINLKRIRWADSFIHAGCRWYGVTEPLRRNHDTDTSFLSIVKGSARRDSLTDLSPQALNIVEELYSMKGITGVWVGTFGIDVQKAPIFYWDDYHSHIVELLNTSLFDGKADIGSRADNTDA